MTELLHDALVAFVVCCGLLSCFGAGMLCWEALSAIWSCLTGSRALDSEGDREETWSDPMWDERWTVVDDTLPSIYQD